MKQKNEDKQSQTAPKDKMVWVRPILESIPIPGVMDSDDIDHKNRIC